MDTLSHTYEIGYWLFHCEASLEQKNVKFTRPTYKSSAMHAWVDRYIGRGFGWRHGFIIENHRLLLMFGWKNVKNARFLEINKIPRFLKKNATSLTNLFFFLNYEPHIFEQGKYTPSRRDRQIMVKMVYFQQIPDFFVFLCMGVSYAISFLAGLGPGLSQPGLSQPGLSQPGLGWAAWAGLGWAGLGWLGLGCAAWQHCYIFT